MLAREGAIVFYPRFFEMLNAALEDWFASLGRDFRALHLEDRIGTPTVRLDTEFLAPAMLGDELETTLTPVKVGTKLHLPLNVRERRRRASQGRGRAGVHGPRGPALASVTRSDRSIAPGRASHLSLDDGVAQAADALKLGLDSR